MHDLGFVHNDIKLDNILVGFKDPALLYLIDFGLTCRYLNEDGSHIEKEFLKKFSGNFLFASLNSCRGNNKSRRDDVQSAIYIMIYFLNDGQLPWSNFHTKFEDQDYEFKDFLKERQKIEYTKQLFDIVPKSLRSIIKTVLTLTFEEDPPYDKIYDKLNKEISNLNKASQQPHIFEWQRDQANHFKK